MLITSIFSCLFSVGAADVSKDPLKFIVITDTHCNVTPGMLADPDGAGKSFGSVVLDSVFEQLAENDEFDVILIAGDLTNSGAKSEHDGFLQKLQVLKDAGKKVFVITASHDYRGRIDETGATDDRDGYYNRALLPALYADYGFGQAIASYKSMNYVAQLAPGYRLLALNLDSPRYFTDEHMAWALGQIEDAKAAGDEIIAMWHYPLLAPTPIYGIVAAKDMIGNMSQTAAALADGGLRFAFSGHTHMQNINYFDTPGCNRLYEINTGSLYESPVFPIREVVLNSENMTIHTGFAEISGWDFEGKTQDQYIADKFNSIYGDVFNYMATDIEKFADIAASNLNANRDTIIKNKFLINTAGKILDKITFGKIGCLLLCGNYVDKSIKDKKATDFVIEAVHNIYAGDEPYSQDTPIGRAVQKIMGRLEWISKPLLKLLKVELPADSLTDFVMSLIYDPTPDNNAVLTVK
ncbi:MAG: metallophosphoesterase, partial [Oscillospiraceae bacterium]|nr:metallophosphoesterase [Oscillospiraceae bacterium]